MRAPSWLVTGPTLRGIPMSATSQHHPSPLRISSAAVSPVRTSPPPAREPGWLVSDPACFSRWPESFASYDPASSSWRTSQRSLLGGWMSFSGRWPLSGTMRGGEVCEHRRWVHLTEESDGSVSGGEPKVMPWATPTKHDSKQGGGWSTYGRCLPREVLQAWPTMTASEAKRGHGYQRDQQGRVYPTLTGATGAAQAWPTPDSGVFNYAETPASFDARARKRKQEKQDNGNGNGKVLAVEVRRSWPTASATDYKGSSKPGQRRGQFTEPIEPGSGGRLNPAWVEMLMGFPAGWTSTDGPPLRGLSTPTSRRAPAPDNPTTEHD